jgi:phage RecT family recombinase
MNDVIEKRPQQDWKSALNERIDKFASVLPADVNAEDFIAVCRRAVMRDPALKDCMAVNPGAAFNAFLDCARDGLLPDGREAHIDCRNDKRYGKTAAYMPMRRGLVKMLYRTGSVTSVNLTVVREGDEFDPDLSEGGRIIHRATGSGGSLIAVWGIVTLKNGGVVRSVMWSDDVEKRRRVAKTQNVWSQWPAEMWKKTLLHNMAKDLPLTPNAQAVFDREFDHAELNAELVAPPVLPKRLILNKPPADEPTEDAPQTDSEADLKKAGHAVAKKGMAALSDWYDGLSEDAKAEVAERFDTTWSALAQDADARRVAG